MEKEKAIELLKIIDRFIDKNPSMFEYDNISWADYSDAIDIAIDALERLSKE